MRTVRVEVERGVADRGHEHRHCFRVVHVEEKLARSLQKMYIYIEDKGLASKSLRNSVINDGNGYVRARFGG